MGQDQHSIPVFLQKGWVSGDSGKVPYATILPQHGKFLSGVRGPKSLNYVVDQWTVLNNGTASYEIEDGFTNIDTLAAPLIQRMREQKGLRYIAQAEKKKSFGIL